MKRALILPLLLTLLLATGCRRGNAPDVAADAIPQDLEERDAVLAVLQDIRPEALRDAFDALPRYPFTQYTRTEQFGPAQQRIAFREHVTRNDLQDGVRVQTALHADSAGVFDFGLPGRFAATRLDGRAAPNPTQDVFPDDPSYLAPRNWEAFVYRFLPDTLLFGAATQVIEVRAQPGVGDRQKIRRTRLYLDRRTGDLVAFYLERVERSLLFGEESRFYLHLRPAPGGGWAPYLTRFQTRIQLPLRAPRQLHTVSTYYAYREA